MFVKVVVHFFYVAKKFIILIRSMSIFKIVTHVPVVNSIYSKVFSSEYDLNSDTIAVSVVLIHLKTQIKYQWCSFWSWSLHTFQLSLEFYCDSVLCIVVWAVLRPVRPNVLCDFLCKVARFETGRTAKILWKRQKCTPAAYGIPREFFENSWGIVGE